MRSVLVTGGAGYIGSMLTQKLLESGYRVTVIDNFRYRQNSLSHLCHYPQLTIVNGDIRDYKLISEFLGVSDIIIPLAALVGAPLCDKNPWESSHVNKDAPLAMFKKLGQEQWVIMPSTNSAYGSGDDGYCTELTKLNPISLYAKDKVEVEGALMQRENSVSLRLATVFGMSPRMRLDLLVNDFVHRGFHDNCIVLFESHFKRNFIHVKDVVSAIIHTISNFSLMANEIYNVGLSDANLSKLELCQVIKRHLPRFTILNAHCGEDKDKRNYVVSNAKIERSGFKPSYSLDQGIAELIKGYQMIKNTRYTNT